MLLEVLSSVFPMLYVGFFELGFIFGPQLVKRFALDAVRPLSACLSVLSVMLVYYGQTVGWIEMKLGMQVGLGLATLY